MIEFDRAHNRYWRDQRGNRDAAIPVRGGDIIERDGRRYAVLFDRGKVLVAAYEIVCERLGCRKMRAVERGLAMDIGCAIGGLNADVLERQGTPMFFEQQQAPMVPQIGGRGYGG